MWIWRSQAFCESHEWYIAIGRCVTAASGYLQVARLHLQRHVQNGSGSNQRLDARAQVLGGWRPARFALRRRAEALQHLAPRGWMGTGSAKRMQARALRPLHVALVPVGMYW